MFKRLATIFVAPVIAVLGFTAAASASTGPAVYSPEQAGYSATGAHFRFMRDTFVLPDASNFASEVDSFGLSVQLMSASQWAVLGISTGTGAPDEPWNAAFAVFNRSDHSLAFANGNSPQMFAGDTVTEQIFYNRTTGNLEYGVFDATRGTSFTGTFTVGPSAIFNQTRVGAEFACDPFDNLACSSPLRYTAPAGETHLITVHNVSVTTYAGHRSGLNTWWAKHQIIMTRNGTSTGAVDVKPHGAWPSTGRNFGIYFQP